MQEVASNVTLLSVSAISTLCPQSCFLFIYVYAFVVTLLIIGQLINRFSWLSFLWSYSNGISKHSILSLNVWGLRNRVKRNSIFSFLKDKNCQFYFLQEIYSVPDDANTWSNEWGGDIFFSHGSTHSRGVCILINPSCSYTVESLNRDQNGRIISINLSSGSANISLCNIYAPNDLQQQLAFLGNLNNFLITNVDIGNLIVGGDWFFPRITTPCKSSFSFGYFSFHHAWS